MVNSAEPTEKRECAAEGKVQSITSAKFPVNCSNRGSAGTSEEVATPATECKIELLEDKRIVTLKTKGRARENTGDENGRREGERETFTRH